MCRKTGPHPEVWSGTLLWLKPFRRFAWVSFYSFITGRIWDDKEAFCSYTPKPFWLLSERGQMVLAGIFLYLWRGMLTFQHLLHQVQQETGWHSPSLNPQTLCSHQTSQQNNTFIKQTLLRKVFRFYANIDTWPLTVTSRYLILYGLNDFSNLKWTLNYT